MTAAILALMTVGGVVAAMYLQQSRVQANRLELALRDVNLLSGQAEADPQGDPAKWHSAQEAVKRAENLLGPLIDAASQQRVMDLGERIAAAAQAAERDAALLREAVDIRSAQGDDPDGSVSDAAYARAFREAKLDLDALGPVAVGEKIRARPSGVAPALVAALDDWSSQRRKARPEDVAGWKRLTDAARAADPDATRDRLRQIWSEFDRKRSASPCSSWRRGPIPGIGRRRA